MTPELKLSALTFSETSGMQKLYMALAPKITTFSSFK